LSGRGLCDELITHPEESYRLCCVVVCDLETSRMGAPYIYDISHLRVKSFFTDSIPLLRLARDQNSKIFITFLIYYKYQGGTQRTVGWGIVLQARTQVQFLTGSLGFFTDLSFWLRYGPGVDSASNRNEYQDYLLCCKGCRCVGLTNLPSFC